MKELLDYGCNLQIVDNRGHTPMNIAMRNKSPHLKDMLAKYGAALPPDPKKPKFPPNKPPAPVIG